MKVPVEYNTKLEYCDANDLGHKVMVEDICAHYGELNISFLLLWRCKGIRCFGTMSSMSANTMTMRICVSQIQP